MQLTGFNYTYTPEWFDSNLHRMKALNALRNFDNMYYEWSFYRPFQNQPGYTCYLSTSENVTPTIHNRITGERATVEKVKFHNGYVLWRIVFRV